MATHTTKLLTSRYVKELAKGLAEAGYEVERGDDTYKIELDGVTIFWAMAHSSGKHYLVRYSNELLTEKVA